eukprot:753871-Hanusia_phi.AAC.4
MKIDGTTICKLRNTKVDGSSQHQREERADESISQSNSPSSPPPQRPDIILSKICAIIKDIAGPAPQQPLTGGHRNSRCTGHFRTTS